MPLDLQQVAPHMLGAFMIALACIPLVFAWQDRNRRQADKERVARLQREARVTARLRAQSAAETAPRLAADWLHEARR